MGSLAAARAATPRAPARPIVTVAGQDVSFAFSAGPGRALRLQAECLIPTQHAVVWRVLTDYEHLEEFVPFLTDSHTVSREPGLRFLRQEGRVGFLIFHQRFQVTFRLTEQPMEHIWFEAIEGDFKRFTGSWDLHAQGDHTVVRHTVEVEPAFFIPRWLLQRLEQRIMLESLAAVLQRCRRGGP